MRKIVVYVTDRLHRWLQSKAELHGSLSAAARSILARALEAEETCFFARGQPPAEPTPQTAKPNPPARHPPAGGSTEGGLEGRVELRQQLLAELKIVLQKRLNEKKEEVG